MSSPCGICGSKFAKKKCYFCESHVCSSCIVPSDVTGSTTTVKCRNCDRNKVSKISFLSVIKRNKIILGIIVGFWVFTVYPLPFLQMIGYEIQVSAFQPVLMATAIMVIPFIFMFIAWQKRAPKAGSSERED